MGAVTGNEPGPPPFVKLKDDASDDLGDPNNWDGWAVKPSGNIEADYKLGAEYCDICLRKVILTDSVGALTFTLGAMFVKLTNGGAPSPIEKGFLDCLARRAADRRQQLDSN